MSQHLEKGGKPLCGARSRAPQLTTNRLAVTCTRCLRYLSGAHPVHLPAPHACTKDPERVASDGEMVTCLLCLFNLSATPGLYNQLASRFTFRSP